MTRTITPEAFHEVDALLSEQRPDLTPNTRPHSLMRHCVALQLSAFDAAYPEPKHGCNEHAGRRLRFIDAAIDGAAQFVQHIFCDESERDAALVREAFNLAQGYGSMKEAGVSAVIDAVDARRS